MNDPVNHPAHYTKGDIECIDALEVVLGHFGLADFCKGNAIKYIWRAGLKGDAAEDYKKAIWYLNKLIEMENGYE